MKNILTLALLLFTINAFSQKIDENGRPEGSRPTNAIQSVRACTLIKNASSTSTNLKLDYTLPSGVNSGKIVVFHPFKDLELKTIALSNATGNVDINLNEFNLKGVVVGLYDQNNTFIKEFKVK